VKKALIAQILISSLSCLTIFLPSQASAQFLPQPWVSVGEKEGEVTYAVGVRALDFGVEIGTGPDSATGADVLKFLSLPVISPYVGVGWYSEDKGVAFSGGVQVGATDNIFIGAGYNSVRGFNGQLGIKF
jgi:hypothetical protein